MTRINLVHPSELMDQHLFAEFREIKMIPKSLRRSIHAVYMRQLKKHGDASLAKSEAHAVVIAKIPRTFTLNTGHVSFFYNKGAYLRKRYELLKDELRRRGVNANFDSLLDEDNIFHSLPQMFNNDYEPHPNELVIIRERIAERIAQKPSWYRYEGKPIS